MTNEERWEAVGNPEIICHDDGYGGGCYYIGPDDVPRVCEVCGEDEPADSTDTCPACGYETWWSPKCPECGKACAWTYGEIMPLEYEQIMSAKQSI